MESSQHCELRVDEMRERARCNWASAACNELQVSSRRTVDSFLLQRIRQGSGRMEASETAHGGLAGLHSNGCPSLATNHFSCDQGGGRSQSDIVFFARGSPARLSANPLASPNEESKERPSGKFDLTHALTRSWQQFPTPPILSTRGGCYHRTHAASSTSKPSFL
jgi:hypothetical protein